jgi:hypothetical protein
MASITYWNRVEPSPRSNDLKGALAARVRDPLWFLTRQWQFGELRGEDAGSPAWVELRSSSVPMTAWRPQGGALQPIDPTVPLEKVVENESFTLDLAMAVELGQTFESMLTAKGLPPGVIAAFRAAYPVAAPTAAEEKSGDDALVRFRRVMAGRALDGGALYVAALAAQPGLPASPPLLPAQAGLVGDVLHDFLAWVADVAGTLGIADAAAWLPSRLEYEIEVTTGGDFPTLYRSNGGADAELDWDTFDVAGVAPTEAPALPAVPPVTRTIMPANVHFRGMPNARWWDFENARIDFGKIDVERRDLARLIVVDFMLVQGNDWFVIPFEQNIGTVARVESLLVRDVFGGFTTVGPASDGWTMFTSSGAGGVRRAEFVLPPTAGTSAMHGERIEDVRFLRDEMANMVWAIEHTVEGGLGQPLEGYERSARRSAKAPQPPTAVDESRPPLRYRLQTTVPTNWIPFIPVALDPTHGDIALERAAMLDDAAQPILPVGRILNPTLGPASTAYRVEEEEVPRTGIRVERVVARARGTRGQTFLWITRHKTAGRGEGSSGLRFDLADPKT